MVIFHNIFEQYVCVKCVKFLRSYTKQITVSSHSRSSVPPGHKIRRMHYREKEQSTLYTTSWAAGGSQLRARLTEMPHVGVKAFARALQPGQSQWWSTPGYSFLLSVNRHSDGYAERSGVQGHVKQPASCSQIVERLRPANEGQMEWSNCLLNDEKNI